MENQNMDRDAAYDITRREFYRLRQEEEVERRIAVEEARHVGAYFGLNRLEVGMLLEDREYETWKFWAGKEAAKREAAQTAMVETFGDEKEEDDALLDGPPPLEKAEERTS
jgi:small subunit ribosomal protein S23